MPPSRVVIGLPIYECFYKSFLYVADLACFVDRYYIICFEASDLRRCLVVCVYRARLKKSRRTRL